MLKRNLILCLAIITGVVFLVGCDKSSGSDISGESSDSAVPSISTQDSLDFGAAPVGGSSSRQLLISNAGSGTLEIGQLSLPSDSPFQITKDDCSNASIPKGGTLSLTLSLTPASQSDYTDMLTIPSNDSTKNPLTVLLTGKGRALNVAINQVTTVGNVIKLLISVSKAGVSVDNLTETSFTIKENGNQQPINKFTHPIVTSISVDLVFDYSGSLSASAKTDIQKAGGDFVTKKLVSGVDEAGVIKFSNAIGAKTDFTTDRNALIMAIDAPYPISTNNGTILYDTLITAIEDTALRTNSRRAIIVFSDGYDQGSQNTLTAVINRAILKGVPIFTVAYTKATKPMPEIMQRLAQETGGEFFLAPNSSDAVGIYDKISQILSQQYLIEYISSSTIGSTLSLNVEVDNNGDLGEAAGSN
jgi:VWFA-related protein